MAKALIGHLNGDRRTPDRLASENARLRVRVGELEALVLRLSQENDRLAAEAVGLMALEQATQQMQPA